MTNWTIGATPWDPEENDANNASPLSSSEQSHNCWLFPQGKSSTNKNLTHKILWVYSSLILSLGWKNAFIYNEQYLKKNQDEWQIEDNSEWFQPTEGLLQAGSGKSSKPVNVGSLIKAL